MAQPSSTYPAIVRGVAASGNASRRDISLRRRQLQGTQGRP